MKSRKSLALELRVTHGWKAPIMVTVEVEMQSGAFVILSGAGIRFEMADQGNLM